MSWAHRLTEPARVVVVLAQDEALGLKHDYIGTEHILLGLYGYVDQTTDGIRVAVPEAQRVARRVFESYDLTSERIRGEVVRAVGVGGGHGVSGQIPFTPRAKEVFGLARDEAGELARAAPHHLLLGLLRVEDGDALRVLRGLGADREHLRQDVLAQVMGETP